MPKVTVIVPNYNHARFLPRRLDSILSQTYQDFDVLYLDDASTDSSADVFARYASNPRIHALCNTQNSGSPFKQWNKGAQNARGEYLWIAEADDAADPRLLETLVALLDSHPHVGIAYCQSRTIDAEDKAGETMRWWTDDLDTQHWRQDFVAAGPDECRRFLSLKCTLPNASAVLLRRSVLEQVGGADETMRLAGDWMTYIKMLLVSDLAFVAEPLNFFRTHSASVRHTLRADVRPVEEGYEVLRFLLQHATLDADTQDRAFESRLDALLHALIKHRAVPLGRKWGLWRTAQSVDPALTRRLLNRLGRRLRPGGRLLPLGARRGDSPV